MSVLFATFVEQVVLRVSMIRNLTYPIPSLFSDIDIAL